jgi:hypothetical protein
MVDAAGLARLTVVDTSADQVRKLAVLIGPQSGSDR